MKKVSVVTLVAAAVLFLSVVSLQARAQNSSSSQGGRTTEPLPPQTPTDFWDGDEPNLVNLVTHPFASKKYVQRLTRPIADRVNELDSVATENRQTIRDIDARSQKGLQMASDKSSLADQHASDAANKAQLAQTSATQASNRVGTAEQMVNGLDHYNGATQTEIRFRPGQTVLSKPAKDALDAMAAGLKDQHNYIVEVRGFAPGRGQASIASSQKMADSVVRYLVLNHQIPVYRIYAMGMGNAPDQSEGTMKKPVGSRVEVSLLKNDVVSSAK